MKELDQDRKKLYAELGGVIGRTPLVKYKGEVPNGNTLHIKRECDNPFGSHYDRVYLALFRWWEENKGLKPETNMLETTSGSAGVSFAGIGKRLGYNCYVMIPAGDHLKKRREAVKAQGAKLIVTPEEEGINGFTVSRILNNLNRTGSRFLNHSTGPRGSNNEVTLTSLEAVATEVLQETEKIDVYVVGIGNGSSIVGPGRVLKKHNPDIQIIGYKPKKSGKSNLPGLINQDGLYPHIRLYFPHVEEAKRLMDQEVLVDDKKRTVIGHEDLGETTKAGIFVALQIAETVSKKNLLVLAYDKIERY